MATTIAITITHNAAANARSKVIDDTRHKDAGYARASERCKIHELSQRSWIVFGAQDSGRTDNGKNAAPGNRENKGA